MDDMFKCDACNFKNSSEYYLKMHKMRKHLTAGQQDINTYKHDDYQKPIMRQNKKYQMNDGWVASSTDSRAGYRDLESDSTDHGTGESSN